MGNKYEVLAWTNGGCGLWEDVQKYHGEWFIAALFVALKLKLNGCGCVTIKWRP
jgi:hypothetical protein